MAMLFTITLFLSASLLFLVQPLLARMVLPLFGGSPAVWNTCMVVFQALLLAGYAYAHLLPRWLGLRWHALLHVGLLMLAFLALPLALPANWTPASEQPIASLLYVLLLSAGLPFFVVSTSGPLLQRWFAASGHARGGDPYFLYVASNLGSMLALLGYPLLVEPRWRLHEQAWLWSAGYGLLVVATALCAGSLWFSTSTSPTDDGTSTAPPLTWPRRLRWVALAFVPSSLMLSVTTYLTTDIAAIPLLWVVPLAIYLFTFILAFARRQLVSLDFVWRRLPITVLTLTLLLLSEATDPVLILISLHLFGLFWIGLACHGQLAADRPSVSHLTEFYLLLSVGGVLGGVFNALVAPLLFDSLAEYPLILVVACLMRPTDSWRQTDVLIPALLGLGTAALVWVSQKFGLPPGTVSLAVIFAGPLLFCYFLVDRPLRFGLAIGAVLLASTLYRGVLGTVEYRTRSFFGVHRVTRDVTNTFRILAHGNTVHGQQALDPAESQMPLTYYFSTGPIGQLFTGLGNDPRLRRVGVVGLGAGALAGYARPGQHWTYFEIDAAVVHIASDEGARFTFIQDARARGATVDCVVGDARLTLPRSGQRFGLLVIDAFSSDAIPMHLLTRQAMAIYCDQLEDDGLLIFNVSNRYLDLVPELAALAEANEPPLVCWYQNDRSPSVSEKQAGKAPSVWCLMGKTPATTDAARWRGYWRRAKSRPDLPAWTDDFSNLFQVLRLRDPEAE